MYIKALQVSGDFLPRPPFCWLQMVKLRIVCKWMDLRARMQDGVVLWWIWIWFRIAVDLSLVVNNGFVRVSAKCVVIVGHRWPIVETRAALFAICRCSAKVHFCILLSLSVTKLRQIGKIGSRSLKGSLKTILRTKLKFSKKIFLSFLLPCLCITSMSADVQRTSDGWDHIKGRHMAQL